MKDQIYMDDSEFNAAHYYFNQIIYPESYQHILEIILLRKKPFLNDIEYQNLVKNSMAMFSISRFYGKTYSGSREYAQIGNRIEIICFNDFNEPELSKLLDGPFNSFQELKSAFNVFLEAVENQNIIDFYSQDDNSQYDESNCDKREELDDDFENEDISSCKGEYGTYYFGKLKKNDLQMYPEEMKSSIAKKLSIDEKSIWEIVDTEIVYNIYRFEPYSGEKVMKSAGERFFAKVGDKWQMIYNDNFGEPELGKELIKSFDSETDLVEEIRFFIDSIGDEPLVSSQL